MLREVTDQASDMYLARYAPIFEHGLPSLRVHFGPKEQSDVSAQPTTRTNTVLLG